MDLELGTATAPSPSQDGARGGPPGPAAPGFSAGSRAEVASPAVRLEPPAPTPPGWTGTLSAALLESERAAGSPVAFVSADRERHASVRIASAATLVCQLEKVAPLAQGQTSAPAFGVRPGGAIYHTATQRDAYQRVGAETSYPPRLQEAVDRHFGHDAAPGGAAPGRAVADAPVALSSSGYVRNSVAGGEIWSALSATEQHRRLIDGWLRDMPDKQFVEVTHQAARERLQLLRERVAGGERITLLDLQGSHDHDAILRGGTPDAVAFKIAWGRPSPELDDMHRVVAAVRDLPGGDPHFTPASALTVHHLDAAIQHLDVLTAKAATSNAVELKLQRFEIVSGGASSLIDGALPLAMIAGSALGSRLGEPSRVDAGSTGVDPILSGRLLSADIDVLRAGGDRLLPRLGPARLNNAEELSRTIASIEEAGGKVAWRPGQFAFSPAKGRPGLVLLDPDASISAVRHEAGHFFDDLKLGSPGLGHYYENPGARWASEFSSYTQEIRLARQLGDRRAAWQLLQDAREERMLLLGR